MVRPGAVPKSRTIYAPQGISGAHLAEAASTQACRFGAEIGREVVRGEFHARKGIGHLADGTKISARAAICATGVEYRRLKLAGEENFLGVGVYYGAGASEASLCWNDDVYIIGAGIKPFPLLGYSYASVASPIRPGRKRLA